MTKKEKIILVIFVTILTIGTGIFHNNIILGGILQFIGWFGIGFLLTTNKL